MPVLYRPADEPQNWVPWFSRGRDVLSGQTPTTPVGARAARIAALTPRRDAVATELTAIADLIAAAEGAGDANLTAMWRQVQVDRLTEQTAILLELTNLE